MKSFFVLAVLAGSAVATIAPPAVAATHAEVMQSRYMKYQFCMEKTYGQGFDKKLKLDLALNRWGNSEPTLSSLSKAADSVQKVEAKCRSDNQLSLEPRPQ
jgi:hypothetical protein